MDVEAQILKHLPRDARGSISFIDKYCSGYRSLFAEVRSYECCKDLHLGIITKLSRKSLPEIGKVVGVNSGQALHHFVAKSPWSVEKFRDRRLEKTIAAIKGKAIMECGYCQGRRLERIDGMNLRGFLAMEVQK